MEIYVVFRFLIGWLFECDWYFRVVNNNSEGIACIYSYDIVAISANVYRAIWASTLWTALEASGSHDHM